ncbi:MAG: MarC family protein [Bacteroidales bacterium]
MNDSLSFALLCFTSFFTLINPLGVMSIFMTLTKELTDEERNRAALKACRFSFLIICAFALSGQMLFKFFGISADSFRVVGGVIFFIMGMDMLQARLSEIKVKSSEVKSYVRDISITPLAIPMICGPGAITNGIVLMEDAQFPMQVIILIAVILAVMVLTYFILRSSSTLLRIIGETGNNVMMRLMGLIVMVIAVEFLFAGLKPFVVNILESVQ